MFIADAHLDLAYNALRGRDVIKPAKEQKPDDESTPSVGLPDLRAGGVGLVCATIFCMPSIGGKPGYRTPEEAHAVGWEQLQWYMKLRGERRIRIVTTPDELPTPGEENSRLHTILLLEGADPIYSPADAHVWFQAGVRIVGLAWKGTRYAGGTGAPGPLTSDGVELVKTLDELGMIHDASHLAEESFWQLMDLSTGPVIASHSNCRVIVPTDRQLSDEMIKAVVARQGVIGINFYAKFLLPPEELGKRRATVQDVVRHVRHIADLAGTCDHIGLGTDMDGGFGAEKIPAEVQTSADLVSVAAALSNAGFSEGDIGKIMGDNWLRYFRRTLPK